LHSVFKLSGIFALIIQITLKVSRKPRVVA
jgi:hypothetical protein